MIELRAIDAEVLPAWEIILPTGNIELRGEDQFSGFFLGFTSRYNFIDNTIGAGVSFSYPFLIFNPGIRFFQDVDLESTVDVSPGGTIVELNTADSYISRRRGFTASIPILPTDWLSFGPAFTLTDTFEGDIETSQILDEAVYLQPALLFAIDTLRVADLAERIYTGLEIDLSTQWRFRNSFENAVEWDILSSVSLERGWMNDLYMSTRLETGLPVKIWERDTVGYYSFGGSRSLHGYPPSSIPALRYAMLNVELKSPAVLQAGVYEASGRRGLRFQRLRGIILTDLLASQGEYSIHSGVEWHASFGTGFSMLMSGKGKRYFRTRAYVAVPIAENPVPVFFLETSLFSIRQGL